MITHITDRDALMNSSSTITALAAPLTLPNLATIKNRLVKAAMSEQLAVVVEDERDLAREDFMESVVLDLAGHRRSPATMPGSHSRRPPRNKVSQYPADPRRARKITTSGCARR